MNWLQKPVSILPLAVFRILFGGLMAVSTFRFWFNDWIESQYLAPEFFFSYYGFSWVQPLGETGIYLLFSLIFLSAIGVMLGLFYRWSIVLFFLAFTYVELIDATNYLNHYYYVSLISFLMIWLPAAKALSLDVRLNPALAQTHIPFWSVGVIKLQIGLTYFFAGLAKLNYDWMMEALPLKLWLPSCSNLPFLGFLLEYELTAYLFSWVGAFYDITIVFFLLNRTTRGLAFGLVVIFHLLTAVLFPIGMFPYIMIASALIFFSGDFYAKLFSLPSATISSQSESSFFMRKAITGFVAAWFIIQLALPLRHFVYSGDLFWNELGYRFSWRVMLMEKAGHTTFTVIDGETGARAWVRNCDHLSRQQEKMMSTQPDLILQYAHHLERVYSERGFNDPKVYCTSKVSLNGRPAQTFVDPKVDLTTAELGWQSIDWILEERNLTDRSEEHSASIKKQLTGI